MSVALHESMTLPEFLDWEEHQQSRFEFDGFHPVAMTGGTVAHNRIMRRLHRLLEQQLDGTSCEPFGPDVKIIADGSARRLGRSPDSHGSPLQPVMPTEVGIHVYTQLIEHGPGWLAFARHDGLT